MAKKDDKARLLGAMGKLSIYDSLGMAEGDRYELLSIAAIDQNPQNARTVVIDESLSELVASIKDKGVLQPIIVRPTGDGRYQVVAGSRRYEAARQADLIEIPAMVKTLDDEQARLVNLIENVQRRNLSRLEEADAYRAMMRELGLTERDLAARLGKSRGYVENLIAPADMPAEMRQIVAEKPEAVSALRQVLTVPDESARAELLDGIRQGDTLKATTEKVKEAKNESLALRKAKTPYIEPADLPMSHADRQLIESARGRLMSSEADRIVRQLYDWQVRAEMGEREIALAAALRVYRETRKIIKALDANGEIEL